MFVPNEYNEYETEISGIKFVCETPDEILEETAAELAEIYPGKLKDIAGFMIDEGISDCFGELTAEKIISSLGKPVIDLERFLITYPEQTLDDIHIIELEYDGLLDEFLYFSIDG